MLVALELEDCIDHVFQNLRTCYAPFLVDVADDDDWGGRLLGKLEQHGGTLAYLAHTAGTALDVFGGHRLYGIDDDEVGLHGLDMFEHTLYHHLTHHLAVGQGFADSVVSSFQYAVGTQFQLSRALLAADVEYGLAHQAKHRLQDEGGFSDAGLAAKQCERTRHKAATQHAVEFAVDEVDAGFVGCRYLTHRYGARFRRQAILRRGTRHTRLLAEFLLDEGVPFATRRTASHPLGRVVAA